MLKFGILCGLLASCLSVVAAATADGPAGAPQVGEDAPAFTVTGTDGPVSLAEVNARSEGPVAVSFARGKF